MTSLPRITVLSYGGTIASVVQPGVGAVPSLDVGEMARQLPGVAAIAEIDSRPFPPIASPHMTFLDLLALTRTARRAVAEGSRGVVVTQGTDTIEEIAFGLDLLTNDDTPVVVTGAMRNASMTGADGPANVLSAIRVAASAETRGLGALVVMNDEIHAARFVRKTHTQSTAAFRSPQTGPIGWIAEEDVRILVRPRRMSLPPLMAEGEVAPVALLKLSLGDDGRLLKQLPSLGFAGLVIEGFGGGHVTAEIAAAGVLELLVEQMPVVFTSRSGNGEVLRGTYGFVGSETDLIRRGVVFAGALDGPKSRVLLTLLLMAGASRDAIRSAFADVGPLAG